MTKPGGYRARWDTFGGACVLTDRHPACRWQGRGFRRLRGTWEPVGLWSREPRKRRSHKRLRTDAGHRGGATHSSVVVKVRKFSFSLLDRTLAAYQLNRCCCRVLQQPRPSDMQYTLQRASKKPNAAHLRCSSCSAASANFAFTFGCGPGTRVEAQRPSACHPMGAYPNAYVRKSASRKPRHLSRQGTIRP